MRPSVAVARQFRTTSQPTKPPVGYAANALMGENPRSPQEIVYRIEASGREFCSSQPTRLPHSVGRKIWRAPVLRAARFPNCGLQTVAIGGQVVVIAGLLLENFKNAPLATGFSKKLKWGCARGVPKAG